MAASSYVHLDYMRLLMRTTYLLPLTLVVAVSVLTCRRSEKK